MNPHFETLWVPKIPFRLQISQFGLSDQNFGTPQGPDR
jgi:hypothetical protein